jgi:hypothetical protein
MRYVTLLALTFMFSCSVSPHPVLTLQVIDNEKVTWLQGLAYQRLQNDTMEIAVAFVEAEKGLLTFDVIVSNPGDSSIIVDPKSFYYHGIKSSETPSQERQTTKFLALDPEKAIISSQFAKNKEEARYASEVATNLLFDAVYLTADVAGSFANATPEQKKEKQRLRDNYWHMREEQNIANLVTHEYVKRNISYNLQTWKHEALRRTTLHPGFSIQGYVFFPAYEFLHRGNYQLRFHYAAADSAMTLHLQTGYFTGRD